MPIVLAGCLRAFRRFRATQRPKRRNAVLAFGRRLQYRIGCASGPLFPVHCLVNPKQNVENLGNLSDALAQPIFVNAQLIATARERGLNAEGALLRAPT